MKKILLSFFSVATIAFAQNSQAQTFNVAADTVYITATANVLVPFYDLIYDVSANNVVLKWRVTGTDFPANWISNLGLCDNHTCYYASALFNNGNPVTQYTNPYVPYVQGDSATYGVYDMQLLLPDTADNGTHYLTVTFTDTANLLSTKTETFVINKFPTAVPSIITNNNVSLYPNPAHNDVNLVYNASAGIRLALVYNMIGKVVLVNKVSTTSADINIEALPSGMYFVRLTDNNGGVIATRKFTKQ